ncbi:MAG TPA: GNAT family N-acetyltransferase, partial [Ilumatobacteraceae bacterium]|nr:GNAT family N-acetyltransferase [Ilumatobacteraceae bacterium]
VYVARCGGTIVGMAVFVPHRHLPGLRFHVEDVVVDERHRRQGVARALLTAGMRDAPDGVLSFDLRSHRSRDAAHALYLDLGFVPSDTTVFRRVTGEL